MVGCSSITWQIPQSTDFKSISNRCEGFITFSLLAARVKRQTWFRGRKAGRVLWHRGAQSCVRYQLVEEQLLNKMAWGTALNSSMPQNAPRLPPSEPCLEKSYVSTPFIVFRLQRGFLLCDSSAMRDFRGFWLALGAVVLCSRRRGACLARRITGPR